MAALPSRDHCDTLFPGAWDRIHETQIRFRGELYGLPWNMNAMAVFYARPPFDPKKFDYSTDDWTYEDCMN